MLSNSVLNTIKKMIGPSESYHGFDEDLIVLINSTLMVLAQIAVVKEGTRIKDETTTWGEIVDDRADIDGIKEYIYLKVKATFDPNASSSIQQALAERAKELEWRLYAFSDIMGKKGGQADD